MEERIVELQTKVAYQEDLVQELNAIVATQQKQIDQLQASLLALNGHMKELSELMPGGQTHEGKPPHY